MNCSIAILLREVELRKESFVAGLRQEARIRGSKVKIALPCAVAFAEMANSFSIARF
jgi:hypothetical protein